jgi:SAM-dependent methyltransferase
MRILKRVIKFVKLSILYGFFKTLRLYNRHLKIQNFNSQINKHINSLIDKMAQDIYVDGSAAEKGWLYHDYALPEDPPNVHRKKIIDKLLLLKKYITTPGKRILDIGCSSGGFTIGLAMQDASRVIGVDHDKSAIDVAEAMAEKYRVYNAEFHASELSDFRIPKTDIILWLSQWMWIVKQFGLEYGKEMLFEIPRQAGADTMVFESAAAGGMAVLPNANQDDIAEFLYSWTPYRKIENIGSFKDDWCNEKEERKVFVCSEPVFNWKTYQANITRVDARTIFKKYKPEFLWAKDVEAQCLQRLKSFPYFPNLLEIGDDWIKIEWVGRRATSSSPLYMLNDILKILSKTNIVHRDITPSNILCLDHRLFLIDFGWAMVDGRETVVAPPRILGLGFYEYGKWDDSQAVKKIYDRFKR